MNNSLKNLYFLRNYCLRNNLIFLSSKSSVKETLSRTVLKKSTKTNQIDPLGWFLLIIPASAFGLGVWQLQRKTWKENLIRELKSLSAHDPIKLPESIEEVNKLEYRPIHVRGEFLHDKEIYIGPRTLLSKGEASTSSSLMTSGSNTSQGYLVVTPFKLEDTGETILINRGWVPAKKIDPKTRREGQVNGTVDVIGIVRLNETRPVFTTKNQSGSRLYFYRDLASMCEATGALPVFLDQTNEFNVKGGPIGGQTRISLRNEHLSYILTWFSLCGATGFMWYKKFLAR